MEIKDFRSVPVICKCGRKFGNCAGLSAHMLAMERKGLISEHNTSYHDKETSKAIEKLAEKEMEEYAVRVKDLAKRLKW